jgi:hypothetical protein
MLARPHPVQLVFLEVRGDPDLRRYDRDDRRAGCGQIADLDVALGDPAVLGRRYMGIAEVDRGGVLLRLGLDQLPFG